MPIDPETGARFRIHATQSTKDIWTTNASIEYKDDHFTRTLDSEDLGNVEKVPLGRRLLELVKQAEVEWRLDGRVMAGEQTMTDKQKESIKRYYEKNRETINKNRRDKYAENPQPKRKKMIDYLHDMKANDPVKYRAMLDKKKAVAMVKASKEGRIIHPAGQGSPYLMARKTLFHIWIGVEELDEIERFVADPATPVSTKSECFREMAKLGMQTFHYSEMAKDPEKAAEFAEKISILTKDGNKNKWVQAQSETDLIQMSRLITLERNDRYNQRLLV